MTEVLRIILFISVLASSLHLSISQASGDDDERLQVSGRRLFEVEKSQISQLGGTESHERRCICNVLIPGEKKVTVSEHLNPSKSPAERLVLYLYKVDGHVHLYIPTAEKQNLFPDLSLEDNDVLQEVGAKPLTDLLEDSPYAISKTYFEDIPDAEFEVPKRHDDLYDLYLYKKFLQERLIPYEYPVHDLPSILGNIDRNRLPLSTLVQLKSLLRPKKDGDEYPNKNDGTKVDYYDSPYINHSHDKVTEYPFDPTTVGPEDPEDKSSSEPEYFPQVYPNDKLPNSKVNWNHLESLLPEPTYPAPIDFYSHTSKSPNYEALQFYPGEQSEYLPSGINVFPLDHEFNPELELPKFQGQDRFEFFVPKVVPEERLIPFGPLKPVSNLQDRGSPADPKDESSSKPMYFPQEYSTDELPVPNVSSWEPLVYELPQPYPGYEKQLSYNQVLKPLLKTKNYPAPIDLYSYSTKYPNFEALPFYPGEQSKHLPSKINTSPYDYQLYPALKSPKFQDLDEFEFSVPDLVPEEESLEPYRPLKSVSKSLDHGPPADPKDESPSEPKYIPQAYARDALPISNVLSLEPLVYDLLQQYPGYEKQLRYDQVLKPEESLIPFGPLKPVSNLQNHGSPADPKDESSSEPKYFPQEYSTDELPVPNVPLWEPLVYELPQPYPGYEKQLSYSQVFKPMLKKINYPTPIDLYSHSTKYPNFEALRLYPGEQLEYLPSKTQTFPYSYDEIYPDLKTLKFQTATSELFDYDEPILYPDDERPEYLNPSQSYLEPIKENAKKFDYDIDFPYTSTDLFDFDEPKFYPHDEEKVNLKPIELHLIPDNVDSDYKLYPDVDNSKFNKIYSELQNSYPEKEPIILEPLQPEVKSTKENVKPLEFELYPDKEPPKFQDTSFNLEYVLPIEKNSGNLDLSSQFPDFDVLPFDDDLHPTFSEYPLIDKPQPPEDSYALLKFLSSHQLPSWDQLLPEKHRPKTQQLTFEKWFTGELKDVKKPENLNLYTLKITIMKILQENQVIVTEDGILIDKYGVIINTADLKLRPLLIGKPVGFKNLLSDNGTKTFKMSNSSPYLYSLLVSLGSPAKILGLIPLGFKSPIDSSEQFSENTEPIMALPDYSSGVHSYPSVAQIAKPVSQIHFDNNYTEENYELLETSIELTTQKDFTTTFQAEMETSSPARKLGPAIEYSFVDSDESFDLPETETSTEFLIRNVNITSGTFSPVADLDSRSQLYPVSGLDPVEFSYDFEPNTPDTVEQLSEVSDHPYFSTTEFPYVANDVALKQLPDVHQHFPVIGSLDESPYLQTTETPYVLKGILYPAQFLTEVSSVTGQNKGSSEFKDSSEESSELYTTAAPSYTFEISPKPYQPYKHIQSLILPVDYEVAVNEEPHSLVIQTDILSSPTSGTPYYIPDGDTSSRPDYVTLNQYVTEPSATFPTYTSISYNTALYEILLELLSRNEPDLINQLLLLLKENPNNFIPTLVEMLSRDDLDPKYLLKIKQNIKAFIPRLVFEAAERNIYIPNFEIEFENLNTLLLSRPEFSNAKFSLKNDPRNSFQPYTEIPVEQYQDPSKDSYSIQDLLEILSRKSQNVNPNLVMDDSIQEDISLYDPNSLIELFGSGRENFVPVLTQILQDPKLLAIFSKNYPQLDFKLISNNLNEFLNGNGDSNQILQRLITYVYPRITKTRSKLVLPNLTKETLDQILTLIKFDPSLKVKTEVHKSAEPFQFDGTLNKAPESLQKYIVSPNVNNVNLVSYKLGDEAALTNLFGDHVQLGTPRVDFAEEFDLKDGGKVEKDIDVPEEQKVEEDPEFRIIGGSAATGSGAPLSNKGRAGIIA